jgi:hypothetical protein
MKKLFTDRHGQGKARTAEALDDTTRLGLLELVSTKIQQGWFGESFPHMCDDGFGNAGCDVDSMRKMLGAYSVIDPTSRDSRDASDPEIFDLLEFSYEKISFPVEGDWHSYMRHNHYSYDQEKGRAEFQADVNRILERNGIAFELVDGEVKRLGPAGFHEALGTATFKTGDGPLDDMLEDARGKFLNRDVKVRRESLERLWDAWERLKTLEQGKDKKAKVKALLDHVSKEPTLRQVVEDEANALTGIGNNFMIRHTEVGKVAVATSRDVDYFFQRLFSLIHLLLRATGRGR